MGHYSHRNTVHMAGDEATHHNLEASLPIAKEGWAEEWIGHVEELKAIYATEETF